MPLISASAHKRKFILLRILKYMVFIKSFARTFPILTPTPEINRFQKVQEDGLGWEYKERGLILILE